MTLQSLARTIAKARHGTDAMFDAIIQRQDEIYSLQPACPECSSPQVQVTDKMTKPAAWRCRICKTRFWADVGIKPSLIAQPDGAQ